MSNTTAIDATNLPATPEPLAAPAASAAPAAAVVGARRGVAVWCDRAILGHGIVAVLGRCPQLGSPVWIGDGLHQPVHPHHLREMAVLVVAWDSPQVWPRLRVQLPDWLATGVGVVLVGHSAGHHEAATVISHPRLRWCSPRATADELSAAIASVAAVVLAARPQMNAASQANSIRATVGARGTPPALSEQEQRVLELITTGLKVSAVARRLNVSPHTVHTYLRRIRRKLAEAGTPVASPLELYRAATLWRLVDESESAEGAVLHPRDALGSTG